MRTSHYPTFLIVGLLALIQLFAPWVHAHTGAETGAVLHVPGLEHLQGRPSAFDAVYSDGSALDRMVTLESATEAKPLIASAERKCLVNVPLIHPPQVRSADTAVIPGCPEIPAPSRSPPLPAVAGASPRAPPAIGPERG